MERFQSECPTRWDTAFDSWSGHYRNTIAMRLFHAANRNSPEALTDEELELLEDILIVLKPTKVATVLMQQSGTASLASQYLPLLEGLLRQLGPCEIMHVPSVDPTKSEKVKKVSDLKPLAQKLRTWLHGDYCKMKQKHLVEFNAESLELLQISSFFDPRHKDLEFLETAVGVRVRSKAQRFVVERSEALFSITQATHEIEVANPGLSSSAVAESTGGHRAVSSSSAPVGNSASCIDDNTTLADLDKRRVAKRSRELAMQAKKEERERLRADQIARKAALEAQNAELARKKRRSSTPFESEFSLSRDLFFPPLQLEIAERQKDIGEKGARLVRQVKTEMAFYNSIPEHRDWLLDPVQWWKDRQAQMPHLARAAFTLLGVPGASHALEQAFSRAGRGVDYKRKPRLSGKTGAALIFAHENYRRGHVV